MMFLSKKWFAWVSKRPRCKGKGIFVDFFGIPASTPKGAAIFHINTKAPMLLGVCLKENFKKYHIHFKAINTQGKDIKEITQEYTRLIELYVEKYPDQYFWFHRRWKTKPLKSGGKNN